MRRIMLSLVSIILALTASCGSKEVGKAKQYMDAGMYDQAIELLKMKIGSNPQNAEAHFVLGKCYLLKEELRAANESFERAVLLKPKYRDRIAGAYVDVAMKYLDQRDLRRAGNYFEVATENNFLSKEITARILIETVKQWPPEPTQADNLVRLFKEVSREIPQLHEEVTLACLEIGQKYVGHKMFKEAGRLLEVAVGLDPGNREKVAKLYYEIGANILNSLGDVNKAIGLLDQCVELDSDTRGDVGDLCFTTAWEYQKNNQPGAAYTLVMKGKDLNPKYIERAEAFRKKMPLLFSDDFYDRDFSSSPPWKILRQDRHRVSVNSDGQLQAEVAAGAYGNLIMCAGSPEWTDYSVEGDFYMAPHSDSAAYASLFARMSEEIRGQGEPLSSYCLSLFSLDSKGRHAAAGLTKNVNGRFQGIKAAEGDYLTGVTYRLGLTCRGNLIECFVDGKKVISYTDPDPIRSGHIGLKFREYYKASFLVDNITVIPLF